MTTHRDEIAGIRERLRELDCERERLAERVRKLERSDPISAIARQPRIPARQPPIRLHYSAVSSPVGPTSSRLDGRIQR